MTETPFLLPSEVNKISRITDVTRMRLEKSGRFPKRIKIGARKIAWRRSEIEAWTADPEGWRPSLSTGQNSENKPDVERRGKVVL